jgi:hypothetical protein
LDLERTYYFIKQTTKMKRTRDLPEVCFTSASIEELHPSLCKYLMNPIAQSARHVEDKGYMYQKAGRDITVGGLVNTLKYRYYPHYKDNRSKRKWKSTKIKGSSSTNGKNVDSQIALACQGGKLKGKPNAMAVRLLQYFQKELGHVLQAGQVPVEIPGGWLKMTQADLLTLDPKTGKLHLWEIKTGFPVGFHVKQGVFKNIEGNVDCKKLHIWHLQLHFTKLALQAAGVEVEEANVIQIYEEKGNKEYVVKVHSPKAKGVVEWLNKVKL